ncbi:hypothetical protein BJP36_36940 [Moorena producens JHB]|uniref:Uncharacterized protein n=1 Tax=Moorena producens (strain JHB) TaxID=1454205 RepID=A0A9Q9SU60_MOOP1|nr:hypothetical protein [Moorena producens]WAN69683.1 hypothetical protein BJP36_36940 [Moorena producens JHB]
MGGTPKTALPPQDHLGALSVGELNSPRVAPLHRFASILVHCSLFPVPCSRQLPRSLLYHCSLFPSPLTKGGGIPVPYLYRLILNLVQDMIINKKRTLF